MSNYKKMYYRLFNRISDVIDELKEIQQETEEMFIENQNPNIIKVKNNYEKRENQ